ncbi:hypothetical protein SAMN04488023_10212 [Pedobacter rhizosphaerae]|uniref:Tetratricopeptide repeat-containing protein n=2 Tax=Pedobacter rhizosphaerae TaxID=390241 RepID=A0A1H9JP83_9SPHI|nr:hypothetical protein SAMN04488023_10212 [Pedobacter rhizosphaerae]
MLDSAMLYFKKAQIYVNQRSARYADKKIFLAEAHGVILQNIGDTYYEQSDFKQAEALYLKSIATSKRDYRINPIAMQSEIRLARLYIETGKLKAGRQHLQNAEIMLQNNVLDPMSVDKGNFFLSKTKLNYFIRLGLQDSIKIQSKIFLKIQEKITAKEKLLFDADPGKKIFDLQKDYELDILKKQSQLNRLYLIISIILLAAAAVIVYLMYRYSQRSKQLNKKLNDLNRQVGEQNLNLQNALDVL